MIDNHPSPWLSGHFSQGWGREGGGGGKVAFQDLCSTVNKNTIENICRAMLFADSWVTTEQHLSSRNLNLGEFMKSLPMMTLLVQDLSQI